MFWIIANILVSIALIYGLSYFKKFLPTDSFLFAFQLNFLMMAWYAFTLPMLKLNFNSSYYKAKSFEKNGAIYKSIGVNLFRGFLKAIGWNKISDQSNGRVLKDLNRLKQREKHTKEAELAHLILFFNFLLIAAYFALHYNVFWFLFLNVVLHAYPVFIQRYNRPRYRKLINTFESAKF